MKAPSITSFMVKDGSFQGLRISRADPTASRADLDSFVIVNSFVSRRITRFGLMREMDYLMRVFFLQEPRPLIFQE